MAVSAFRSTCKRATATAPSSSSSSSYSSTVKDRLHDDQARRSLARRSRSVSAVSKRVPPEENPRQPPPPPNVAEFSNKMDNPLFSPASDLSSTTEPSGERGGDVSDGRRGRSVSRGSGGSSGGGQCSGVRKGIGRSLSRVDTGRRRRSVSRGPCGNYESEVEMEEKECSLVSTLRNKMINGCDSCSSLKKSNAISDGSELLSKQMKDLRTWSSQSLLLETGDTSPNWKDGVTANYFSEAEEKTIKSVYEQIKDDHPTGDAGACGIYETVRLEVRRAVSEIRSDLQSAIRRKNPAIITAADMPPELVNPDAIELISDIRREYAVKLEQSQERARKLRADLDVEEQRGKELSRILKEILPDPKTSSAQKSRTKQKTSIERRKMSKRLTEEAMNYFDECVSISTFDSADFSSLEDPSPSLAVALPSSGHINSVNEVSSSSTTHFSSDPLNYNQESDYQIQHSFCFANSDSTDNSSSSKIKDTILMKDSRPQSKLTGFDTSGVNNHFSFRHEAHDIRHYVKKFERGTNKDGAGHTNIKTNYNPGDCDLKISAESLLYEMVILKNRIDSGSLLLCNRIL